VTAALFPQSREVPSVVDSAPSPQYAAAVERAREFVRAAVLEHNLPGVSVAVGAGGTVVWAEGFGWRDVVTRAPVTPNTRFNIGTAASAVTAAVAPLGLTNTGADSAAEWSPEHIGEPEEDFPLFTIIRHVIFRPIGLAPAQPLPGDRATFYVPRSDDNPGRGRRLMYMRDLACCTNGMAFYSTPSDLVLFALATNPGSVNGELAGGMGGWTAAGLSTTSMELVAPDGIADRRLLDVRQRAEFRGGHLPGATHVELGALAAAATGLGTGPTVIMCGHGERATSAASVLERAGHRQVAVLTGGSDDWARATGQELETSG